MIPTLVAVWVLHMAVMLSPGANTLLISQMAVSGQTNSVRWAVMGIGTATVVWASAAIMGLHTVFIDSPNTQRSLQVFGGLYLMWLAFGLWRNDGGQRTPGAQVRMLPALSAYRVGLTTTMTNPLPLLFFVNVFSTALPAAASSELQVAAGTVTVLNSLAWHSLLAYIFGSARLQAGYAYIGLWASRCAAGVMGGLGLKLILTFLQDVLRFV